MHSTDTSNYVVDVSEASALHDWAAILGLPPSVLELAAKRVRPAGNHGRVWRVVHHSTRTNRQR